MSSRTQRADRPQKLHPAFLLHPYRVRGLKKPFSFSGGAPSSPYGLRRTGAPGLVVRPLWGRAIRKRRFACKSTCKSTDTKCASEVFSLLLHVLLHSTLLSRLPIPWPSTLFLPHSHTHTPPASLRCRCRSIAGRDTIHHSLFTIHRQYSLSYGGGGDEELGSRHARPPARVTTARNENGGQDSGEPRPCRH